MAPKGAGDSEGDERMTIGEIEVAARAQGLSYGKYVARLMAADRREIPPVPVMQGKAKNPQRSKPVARCDRDGRVLAVYSSIKYAAKANGVHHQTISRACALWETAGKQPKIPTAGWWWRWWQGE